MNEYDGSDEFGDPLPSEISRVRLINLVGTHNENTDYADDADELGEVLEVGANTELIDDIIKSVPIAKNGDHLNLFYDKGDQSLYVKLFSTIVLWSNIMNTVFGSKAAVATSADVESSFNSLKNGILGGKMSEAHTFIRTHVDFLNAEIKLNAISTNEQFKEPQKRKRSNSWTESSPKIMRKRSNSNQYELSVNHESYSDNGKNKKLSISPFLSKLFLSKL